jgi:hypothetical protein
MKVSSTELDESCEMRDERERQGTGIDNIETKKYPDMSGYRK